MTTSTNWTLLSKEKPLSNVRSVNPGFNTSKIIGVPWSRLLFKSSAMKFDDEELRIISKAQEDSTLSRLTVGQKFVMPKGKFKQPELKRKSSDSFSIVNDDPFKLTKVLSVHFDEVDMFGSDPFEELDDTEDEYQAQTLFDLDKLNNEPSQKEKEELQDSVWDFCNAENRKNGGNQVNVKLFRSKSKTSKKEQPFHEYRPSDKISTVCKLLKSNVKVSIAQPKNNVPKSTQHNRMKNHVDAPQNNDLQDFQTNSGLTMNNHIKN
jgi:hypothetical protein